MSFVEMRSCWGWVSKSSKANVLRRRERHRDPWGAGSHVTMEGVMQLKQG